MPGDSCLNGCFSLEKLESQDLVTRRRLCRPESLALGTLRPNQTESVVQPVTQPLHRLTVRVHRLLRNRLTLPRLVVPLTPKPPDRRLAPRPHRHPRPPFPESRKNVRNRPRRHPGVRGRDSAATTTPAPRCHPDVAAPPALKPSAPTKSTPHRPRPEPPELARRTGLTERPQSARGIPSPACTAPDRL